MSFTSEYSQAIREDFATGQYSKAELARRYGTSPRTIGRILAGEPAPQKPDDQYEDDGDFEKDEDDVGEESEPEYGYVVTPHLIVVTKTTESSSVANTILRSDPQYEVVQAIIEQVRETGQTSLLSNAFIESSVSEKLKAKSFGNVLVNPEAGVVQYIYSGSGERVNIPDRLTARILKIFETGDSDSIEFKGLIKFIGRLAFVRNESIINQLYDFLNATNIAITPEGMVRCYKKVRNDFKDIYTGTIDNSPGQTPQVKFDYVDDNPLVTCSQGLHVCSWSYLSEYSSNGGYGNDVIVEVNVDPADFVAVPKDYNDAKARVCKYYVVQTVTSETPWEIPYNQRFQA